MAEKEKPAGNENLPKAGNDKRRRRKSMQLDTGAIVKYVLGSYRKDWNDREVLNSRRLARYEKLRGWLPHKTWPWENAANFHIPIMLMMSLRMKATLENAIKSSRPVLTAKARQRRNVAKEQRINNLLDYQVFTENKGERELDSFVSNFVDDEAAYIFTHWVREDQTFVDIRVVPEEDMEDAITPEDAMRQSIGMFFDSVLSAESVGDGFAWNVEYEEDGQAREARVEFYERDDGRAEAHIAAQYRTFDGPSIEVMDFEDILYPVRCANLQAPCPSNPRGAAHVIRVCKTNLDTIRRNRKKGIYDLIDDGMMEEIEGARSLEGSGDKEEEAKEQKDRMEGTEITYGREGEDRQVLELYGRWDVNGDGLDEDVIFWVIRGSDSRGWLVRARLLSEQYPGVPVMRPVISASFLPTPNRVMGTSFPQLLESIQEAMQTVMNQHIDWGTITNTPIFFYRASSNMNAEPIYYEPGTGFALDDPQRDVAFPQWPTRDSTYALNTMTLLNQFAERLSMLSDVQFGRVPTGKASALRTLGTTSALLSQGDARSEQVLRRLFNALGEVYQLMHRLNRRFLPNEKEFRVIGVPGSVEDAYDTVRADDISADVDFDFKATLLNTNRQVLATNLQQFAAIMISPLAIQAGIVTPEQVWHLMQDFAKALDLDPERYTGRPPGIPSGPRVTGEEALSMIYAGQVVEGTPAENSAAEHLDKLAEFQKSSKFADLSQFQAMLFMKWFQQVLLLVNQETLQRMALAQAVEPSLQRQNGGPGGEATTVQNPTGDNPPVNEGELIDEALGMV